jgi:hypothetical protein
MAQLFRKQRFSRCARRTINELVKRVKGAFVLLLLLLLLPQLQQVLHHRLVQPVRRHHHHHQRRRRLEQLLPVVRSVMCMILCVRINVYVSELATQQARFGLQALICHVSRCNRNSKNAVTRSAPSMKAATGSQWRPTTGCVNVRRLPSKRRRRNGGSSRPSWSPPPPPPPIRDVDCIETTCLLG